MGPSAVLGLAWMLAAMSSAAWAAAEGGEGAGRGGGGGGAGGSRLPAGAVPREAAPTASGYVVVNESSGARMFFMYYEAEEAGASSGGVEGKNRGSSRGDGEEKKSGDGEEEEEDGRPIVLWLQGGPGCSSMIGNFYELGPWRVGEDLRLHRNPAPWNRLCGLLFLDNPVGSGFSIAPSPSDIPSDQAHVARDVYTALQAFFRLFPSLRPRPFFLAGESYAGKYLPSVGAYILSKQDEQIALLSRPEGRQDPHVSVLSKPQQQQQQLAIRSNLEFPSSDEPPALRLDGVAIGNGLTHPIAQVLLHSPTAYYMGLIDETQSALADELARRTVASIEEENWVEANDRRNELLDYIQDVTGLATLLDVRRTVEYYTRADGVDYLTAFLNDPEVQKGLLNAEVQEWEPCSSVVRKRMASDVPKSTKHLVETLLNRSIPVLLYQGQFDLRDGVASCEAWMQLIQWDEIDAFFAAERKVWKENGTLAGYVRSYSSLTHVVISNAGHLVPADQEYPSQRMIEGWISGDGIA